MPDGQVLEFAGLTKRFGTISAVADLTCSITSSCTTHRRIYRCWDSVVVVAFLVSRPHPQLLQPLNSSCPQLCQYTL